MQTDLIIVSEYCRICHIEPSFLYLLQKGGLIEIDTVEGESYLPASQLYDVERYTRMYYDLSHQYRGDRCHPPFAGPGGIPATGS
ncbi:MAG: chaperone modulator CbpM [Parabacteroides johnsonii]